MDNFSPSSAFINADSQNKIMGEVKGMASRDHSPQPNERYNKTINP